MAPSFFQSELTTATFFVTIIATVISIAATALRFVSTRLALRKSNIEDWLALAALACFLGVVICSILGVVALKGRDLSNVAPEDVTTVLKLSFAGTKFYLPNQIFAKLSILCLYHRIFGVQRSFSLWVKAVAVFQLLSGIAYWIAGIFTCTPVYRYWTPTAEGSCMNVSHFEAAQESVNSFIDLVIVALAMVVLRKVQVSTSTKIKLAIIFALGGLAGVIGFIKIGISFKQTSAHNEQLLALWGIVQMSVSILCCCAPTYKPIFVKLDITNRLTSTISKYGSRSRLRQRPSTSGSREQHNNWYNLEGDGERGFVSTKMVTMFPIGKDQCGPQFDRDPIVHKLSNTTNPANCDPDNCIFGAVTLYASLRCFYLLYLHPASKFPGPRLAAVSNIWYGYHWLSGRYPLVISEVLKTYGNVVRIAPNELVFVTPQAEDDIYSTHTKNLEHFTRTDWLDFGQGDDGLVFERDPVKHREVAKKLYPAFSLKSIKAKEPILNGYVDRFVQKMKDLGSTNQGVDLRTWTDWLAMDISADMAYGREMNQLRNMESSPLLESVLSINLFLAVNSIMKRFPLLSPLQFLFVPPSILSTLPRALQMNKDEVKTRIQHRGHTKHPDYFDQLCPVDAAEPGKKDLRHMEQVAGQLLQAGHGPTSMLFLCTIMFLVQHPESQQRLVKEVRDAFSTYDEITPDALTNFKVLNATIMETLRMTVPSSNGRPRVSPGAVVDGNYIAKGITVQYGHLAFSRSPRYFHEPCNFRPQRWLPPDHIYWDARFGGDCREALSPFSQGPRQCLGMTAAWRQVRTFLAKVLWTFDIEAIPGQNIVFEEDFRLFAVWKKPKFYVRFIPAIHDRT
ncbi:putative Cytochrome P450 [Seiridium cardinale]|uniref:Cytochrome P450 n=1 Tax=Seiridium cardinale TaxID=138064 RepID=A0ABR2XND6_9PEZI